jgi:hypothetical protein
MYDYKDRVPPERRRDGDEEKGEEEERRIPRSSEEDRPARRETGCPQVRTPIGEGD